ncbi:MAG: hypothetical protein GIW97_07300 [Candidatus Eremiobacteraeota bacterium]|nr:hypothetical protein [Candidatus Eremiobacteraeota bacterium]
MLLMKAYVKDTNKIIIPQPDGSPRVVGSGLKINWLESFVDGVVASTGDGPETNVKRWDRNGNIRWSILLPEGIAVLTHSNEKTGSQNLFFYDWDGNLRWQVPQRQRFPNLGYQTVREAPRSQLYAIVNTAGRA